MEAIQAMTGSSSRCYTVGDLIMSCEPLVWILESSAYKIRCAYCLQKNQELRTCSGCHLHRYCNPVCQAADWKVEHKFECALLKTIGTGMRLGTERWSLRQTVSGHYAVPTEMIAKLANKIKLNTMMDIPGIGRASAKDLLLMLPENPSQAEVELELQPALSAMEAQNSLVVGLPAAEFLAYYGILRYNILPIYDTFHIPTIPIGLAVYPQAPPRWMTPVCWDINVVLNCRGRRLVIHAVEVIQEYTGLADLRYSDMAREPFCLTRTARRDKFEKRFGYPCACRRCTEEYDAEINPLRCVTVGCTNRIPSDSRAQKACSECGAINSDRLKQFRGFIQLHENIMSRYSLKLPGGIFMEFCKEIDAAGILQPDAHIRYVYGWELAHKYCLEDRFEEGWQMLQEMVACIRKIHLKYAVMRAIILMSAGKSAVIGMHRRVLNDLQLVSSPAKEKLETLALQVCHHAFEYYDEAKDILAVLFGKKSKEVLTGHVMFEPVAEKIRVMEQAFRGSK
ncbi:uncharacterized protein LOC129596090 [Paramacrobiotus metropolitanus]|uniref:uncharacterized protein LOC129596090 n=1 Tax=Paramacrobiotus metropolitanus TaxID=2943436 RepID=UPI0024463259|nr:uncharacterized protein LOC129596090 [Paramacrobiotus metropolitanus]